MQRHRLTTKLFPVFGALLLAVSLTPFCMAQTTAPTPQVFQVTVVRVKPEMDAGYREFTKETLAAYKKGGGTMWETWTTATLGESFEYWFFRPVENLKQFDQPGPVVKALGEEGTRAWAAKRSRMIVSARTFLVSTLPALSVPRQGDPKLGIGVITNIAPGRTAEFYKWLKENALVANAKTKSKGVSTFVQGLGGNPNVVHVSVFFDSFEDIGNFVQAYGKAVADLKLQPGSPVGVESQVEFGVYRYIPELSLRPAPATATGK